MNRKQKIIVSITGIFLVLMILVGLTYAYFLTKITGNTNDKSISVTTANLVLKYGEETPNIITKNALMPGEIAAVKVFSATNEGNSDVTYSAVLKNVKYNDLTNNKTINGFERQEDLTYTLTCEQYQKDGFNLDSSGNITGTQKGECLSKEKTVFPTATTLSVMVTNSISPDFVQVYKLTITYQEANTDQSKDMNKTFEALVDIVDTRQYKDDLNPYSSNKQALNYQIINSAIEGGNDKTTIGGEVTSFTGTAIRYTTGSASVQNIPAEMMPFNFSPWRYADTEEGASSGALVSGMQCADLINKYVYDQSSSLSPNPLKIVGCDGETPQAMLETINYERVLNTAPDDYGTSYYYRGNVIDNYVLFADKIWRIIRINGDGSIRLITDNIINDDDIKFSNKWGDNAYIGYMYGTPSSSSYDETHKNISSNNIKTLIETWYENNIIYYENFLSDTLFCGDKTISSGTGIGSDETVYSANTDIRKNYPTFECAKGAINSYSRYTSKIDTATTTSKGIDINNDLSHPIGTISVDEARFAGYFGVYEGVTNYIYLSNNIKGNGICTMTPMTTNDVFAISVSGSLGTSSNDTYCNLKPVINLKSTVLVDSGDGTKDNPYTIKLS